MDEPDRTAPRRSFLSETAASPGERRVVVAALAISVLVFGLAAPFAQVKLTPVPAFIPAYQAALALTDLVTAVLLFGYVGPLRSRALLVLGCGYLFSALCAVVHALTFPGLITETGWLGAGPQTTAWLYMIWHGGFALFVLGYALLRRGAGADARPPLLTAIVVTAALVGLVTLAVTAGHGALPLIMRANGYTGSTIVVTGGVWALILGALIVLARDRNRSVLDLWLVAVLCAWLFDVALSTVLNAGRFDLGFYAGRIYGLLANCFVLGVLLVEMARLYGKLDDALATAEARNAALQSSRAALAHAQRFEAMGQLTGGVAHDFNNLLTVIIGNLEMMLRYAKAEPKLQRPANAAIKAVERGQRLTEHLLTFARKQVTHPEIASPNRLLADFEGLLRRAVGEQYQIECQLGWSTDPVRVDPAQLKVAMINLVMNARDAMPDGGRIVIDTANATLDDAEAQRIPDAWPGPHVVIRVTDSGVGMSPEVAAKAFEPFFTTKDVGSSGLGLSQVYGFVRGAGGHVTIDSVPGRGTTVALYLPRCDDVAAPAPGVIPLRAARGTETVLVVEDDEEVLAAALEGLQDLGYRVVPATNAAQALDILRGEMRVEILFSDIVMPGGMNGVQLAVEARRLRPGL
ncbi:MAG: MASE4 domain-containing protein, partial [Alphaproteobacteria bacterium]|nr:MASE4 domain-containing protein [Alphaproteobacteria bacterium]